MTADLIAIGVLIAVFAIAAIRDVHLASRCGSTAHSPCTRRPDAPA